ncbi:MAG: M1 family metallopeptidase [Myxococcaceae bacterium]
MAVGSLLTACATSAPPPAFSAPADAGVLQSHPDEPPPPTLRLLTNVRPVRETLALRLVPTESSFSGTATLELHFQATTDHFWLHAEGLTIEEATMQADATALAVTASARPGGLLLIRLGTAFGPGQARLVLRYRGLVDASRSRGIYRVDEGTTAYLYTFFEPVDARRAFPCFDEPSFKIPWTLSLSVPAADAAFANAPAVSTTDVGGGLKTVAFAETRPLPSYLVAFVVGPFEVVKGAPAGNEAIPLQFVLPAGRAAELHYAQELLPGAVKHLEDLTGVPYPYGKLDVAVVPRYWGTMEHPGLVALGQPILLIAPGQESLQRRVFAANITTHELAHYWFGDLVTNAWWDDTWLNEALGTWLDLKATDAVDPSFRFSRQALGRRAGALAADALPTAKAVRQPVLTATDIEASFDGALTYAKGSIVLGMFERWVGPRGFRRGLQLYLQRNADKSVTSEALFRALDEGSGRPVGDALATFIVQPGAPLVSVALRCKTGALPVLELGQERFVLERGVTPSAATWAIPVCVRAAWGAHLERACILLSEAQAELTLPVAGCPNFVTANEGGLGYYRVAYAPPLRQAVLAHPEQFGAVELASFAGDMAALARRGDVAAQEAFDLGAKLVGSRDSDVVLAGLELLLLIHRDELSVELQAAQSARLQTLLGQRARALGWRERSTESPDELRLRPVVVWLVARDGRDAVLRAEARRLADAWLSAPDSVDADMVNAVLATAAATGDAALFERLLEATRSLPNRRERSQAIRGLGAFTAPAWAARPRALLLDPAHDLRDWLVLLTVQLRTAETRADAYAFLDRSFEALRARMRDDEVAQLFSMLGVFCSPNMRAAVEASFAPRAAKVDGGPFHLAQALQEIDGCARVQSRLRPGATAWLAPTSVPR